MVAQDEPQQKRRKKKRKAGIGGTLRYYLTFLALLFTIRNVLTILCVLVGLILVIVGAPILSKGPLGLILVCGGIGLVVLSLAGRLALWLSE